MPAAWREVALRTSDTCCFRHDMQIGAESNLNSPKPRVCAIHQLPFRASALSTVVRRRVSKTEHESFSLAQEKQRCARLNLCAVSRILSAMMSATGSTADASLLRKRSSDVLDRTCVLCPVDLALSWVWAHTGTVRCGLAGYGRCLLYTSPSPRDKRQSRMPSSA